MNVGFKLGFALRRAVLTAKDLAKKGAETANEFSKDFVAGLKGELAPEPKAEETSK